MKLIWQRTWKISHKNFAKTILVLAGMSAIGCASPDKQQTELNAEKLNKASTFARFVPERKDDFAWENDLIAFRAYGPALRPSAENAGTDCWLKRVDYPVIDLWYERAQNGVSYHKDNGEGLDNYHVGRSMGCGSTGIWLNQTLEQLETYTSWKILTQTQEKTVFVLSYNKTINSTQYREEKQITIELGKRLYQVQSQFFVNDKVAANLPVAIGLTTHDEKAAVTYNVKAGWLAASENLEGAYLGTGVLLAPNYPINQVINQLSKGQKDAGNAMLITQTDQNGRVKYWSGYGWGKQGDISNINDWAEYLNQFTAP
ncbi:DUF4861 family protein [Catenovulum adriaticum]|uniref:DUF4861 domain-containing protein n=1 Tax=Catenovulum adriaticum TaxID=2984846 RepID=A0ABY7AT25_9ALTE|nr:DUF4861 family protein [Catenovulum sp. TS8]WAJ72276.1 DUF4861 domain-containing protein [Catenovulum sp. TS8]